ncbi:unnamed protein product [Leptidea sinapis]|uniref:2-(3-amino-3-carboxypropyl)histidine synthase subunit 2 n=1 Tax=Leptidea sinapis TaxID=189913 RepID=A0A5E4QXR9_9NEOP|nr:unnamed protein product [Leptidea sinapis]
MANFTLDGKICIERELNIIPVESEIDNLNTRFDIEQTCKWINKNQFKKVCLQFPDELLGISTNVYEEIKKQTNVDLYILGDTSYASCCVDIVAAMHVESDAIVHYGHSCFSKTELPTYLVHHKTSLDINEVMSTISLSLVSNTDVSSEKLCLFYDAEYEHIKEPLSKSWFQQYPQSYMAIIDCMEPKPNQYLGRIIKNKSNQEFPIDVLNDCFCIFIAKQWYLLDPASNMFDVIEETVWFKRRRYLIEKCKDANVIGILMCTLAGDQTKDIISRMKQLCKANGKKSYIVSVGKPNVAKLANFPEIDIYVMIACPENSLYDERNFYKPLVYPFELEVALNSNREPYPALHVIDYNELLPGKKHHCDISEVFEGTDVSLITGKIRETKVSSQGTCKDLIEKENWELESIGHNLQNRSWKGLEQKLGESDVKIAEGGRKGIPIQYNDEPN